MIMHIQKEKKSKCTEKIVFKNVLQNNGINTGILIRSDVKLQQVQ